MDAYVSELREAVAFGPADLSALAGARSAMSAALTTAGDTILARIRRAPSLALDTNPDRIERMAHDDATYWRDLINQGPSSESLGQSARPGASADDTGLHLAMVIATQAAILDLLIAAAGDDAAAARAAAKLVMLDTANRIAVLGDRTEEDALRRQLAAMSDHLSTEIGSSVDGVISSSQEVERIAMQMTDAMSHTNVATTNIARIADDAGQNVGAVAAATEELSASTGEIGQRVQRSSTVADAAVREAGEANATMSRLADASRKIEDVVRLINQVAGQTRLLALNATIEAARAGEAGRGFAVVAAEVKSLADQTAKSTDEIRAQVTAIQQATRAAVDAIGHVTGTIGEISSIAQEIAGAVDQQSAATHEISRNAQLAAASSAQVAEELRKVNTTAADAVDLAGRVRDNSKRSSNLMADLQKRLTVVLRSSASGDRRTSQRYSVEIKAALLCKSGVRDGAVGDISGSGALFLGGDEVADPANAVRLRLNDVGEIPARVIARSDKGVHLSFERMSQAIEGRLQGLLDNLQRTEQPFIDKVTSTARAMSDALEQAVRRGEISVDALFDESYVPIQGTNPIQYRTRFLDLTDRLFPSFQEPMLDLDRRVAFCAAVDRNGYLPTHNRKYAQPQGKDPVWNAANARNRRIFDDPAGLADARSTADHLLQTYPRDMGGGKIIRMKSISAPIWVQKRHWGGLRFAMSIV